MRGIENYYGETKVNRGFIAVYEHSKREDPRISPFRPDLGVNPKPKSGFFMPKL